jgi:hypothetical protein
MKRLIISAAFTLAIVTLYQFIDINLFTIDLPRRVSNELFRSLRADPGVDTEIVLFDIGYVHLDTVKTYIEILERLEPKSIGVNLCNVGEKSDVLDLYLKLNKKIITCGCTQNTNNGTSAIRTPDNEVTHFRSDKDSYFELQLSNQLDRLKGRGNNKERINFRGVDQYYTLPLTEIENVPQEIIKDKIILIGFLRDSVITPMNDWYGIPGETEGDMSDAQISANIISTINRNEFINEVHLAFRVLIILAVSLVCTGLIRLARTKYNVINVILGLCILIGLNSLSSYLIVLAFSKGYFLELHEMTVVLIISAIASIYWNTKDGRLKSVSS